MYLNDNIMKSDNLQIHSINKYGNTYHVDFTVFDGESQSDCTLPVTVKTLVAHAQDQAMNVWNDGENQIEDGLLTYVADNYELVIEDLLLSTVVA